MIKRCCLRVLVVSIVGATGTLSPLASPSFAEEVPAGSQPSSETTVALKGESLTPPFPPITVLTPEQLSANEQSRTAFTDLESKAAVHLAEQVFDINQPSWSPPGSEADTRVSRYLSRYTATEERPSGEHLLVQSSVPLQVDNGSGLAPTSLILHQDDEVFSPINPVVPITISKRATDGVAFPFGLTVASASDQSRESPVLTGNRVVFANTDVDTDFMVEPSPAGAELFWQLRSQRSPQDNALVFNLPPGVTLIPSVTLPGGVEVVSGRESLLVIPPATARAADGTSLPVTYVIKGSTLITHVELRENITFPVLVDPVGIAYGYYGEAGGNGQWKSWESYSSCGGCFGFPQYPNLLQLGAEHGWPFGSTGQWSVTVPGWSSAGITRVDLNGLIHQPGNQSVFSASIGGSGGSGVYTFNGFAGAAGPTPLSTAEAFAGVPIAFCAQGAGGSDGNPQQPLCNDNVGGRYFYFNEMLTGYETVFNWASISAATIRYNQPSTTVPSVSMTGVKNGWVGPGEGPSVTVGGQDNGTGVSALGVDAASGIRSTEEMPTPGSSPAPNTGTYATTCNDPFCPQTASHGFGELALSTGVWTLGAWANDPVLKPHETIYYAYVDKSAPTLQASSWEGATFADGPHALEYTAQDGITTAPQSSPQSVTVYMDGRNVYKQSTVCPAPNIIPASGCFALNGTWNMQAEQFGAGPHTVSLAAKDWVGNTTEKTFHITINHAAGTTQHVGPGTLNLRTGDYKLSANDVAITAGPANLSVVRTFDSQSATSGPLGPGWTLSMPDTSAGGQWQSLEPLQGGNVEAITTGGQRVAFAVSGGGYISPIGFQNYTLTEPSTNPAVYQINDSAGNYTQFTKPQSSASFVPTKVAQASDAGGLNYVTYIFSEGRVSEVLGPVPAGVSCNVKLERGCRSLLFSYASSTTASGDAASEWGDYTGRLSHVSFSAWDPAAGEVTTTSVAQYSYDSHGRLRAEWDPRITPTLKSVYGYDPDNQLVAVTPPGQQPFIMNYGMVVGDASGKRLLSVTRPGEDTAEGNGGTPQNTSTPKLSTANPIAGTTIKVSNNGKWSNAPLAYFYQWMQCNISGGECVPILGATNQSYTPQSPDAGHTLMASIKATNATGGAVVATASSNVVTGSSTNNPAPAPPKTGDSAVTTIEYHVPVTGSTAPYSMTQQDVAAWGQTDVPSDATAVFTPDEPQGWPAKSYKRATVFYFDSASRRVNVTTPGGATSTLQYDSYDNVTRTLTPGNRARALDAGSASAAESQVLDVESTYSSDGTKLESRTGSRREVKLPSGSVAQARAHTTYFYDEGAPSGGPYRLVTKTVEGALLGSEETDVRTIRMAYSGQGGLGWQLHKPTGVTVEPESGQTATRTIVYEPTSGNVAETRTPASSGENDPRDATTIFYTASSNPAATTCGKHAEWTGLPCQTRPAKQPSTSPKLPVTTTTYNLWDEPQIATSTVGSETRASTTSYDPAGRITTVQTTSTLGTALPVMSYEYDSTSGALVRQSTSEAAVKSTFNRLGQPTSYSDADGNLAYLSYDIDGRPEEVNDGKGTQHYTYDSTTGQVTKLADSAAGTFSATYDDGGQIEKETYPNGMRATYTRDATNQLTTIAYTKGAAKWYSDHVTPSIHGQWLARQSTLSSSAYAYDATGRLVEAQETPQGQHCTASLFSYNQDSLRMAETRRESSTSQCPTSGGTTVTHSYDQADRLSDAGTEYEAFGEMSSVPASDAGGHTLSSTYYANGLLRSQTQDDQASVYQLDPIDRTRAMQVTLNGNGPVTTVLHYASPGPGVAWTATAGSWMRKIREIGGAIAATQTDGAEPMLQLVNLHGDVIGQVPNNSGASPTLTAEPSAFGVPTSSGSKGTWLGAAGLETEFSSGVVNTGGGAYVPQLGLYLEPGDASGHAAQDPINEYLAGRSEAQSAGERTVTLAGAIEPLPVNAQIEAEFWADPPWNKPPVNDPVAGAELPLGGYDGWAEEYAIETGQYEIMAYGDSGTNATAAHAADCWEVGNHVLHCNSNPNSGPKCLVSFAGKISTCEQVLARARRQYGENNQRSREYWSFIMRVREALNYAKQNLPPVPPP